MISEQINEVEFRFLMHIQTTISELMISMDPVLDKMIFREIDGELYKVNDRLLEISQLYLKERIEHEKLD